MLRVARIGTGSPGIDTRRRDRVPVLASPTVGQVDAVVVSYNSRDGLRTCVAPLAAASGLNVIVVDNASTDGSLKTVADLPVTPIASPRNGGFAYGVNVGVRAGRAPYVLVVNPDAVIDVTSIATLRAALEADRSIALAAPRITNGDGSLQLSLRRFPRLRSTFSQALFLHRVMPRVAWTSEVVRDPLAYERRGSPEWVSGACMLLRRDVLERVGGLDEGFFLYGEDKDLCRRIRDLGMEIVYEPAAVCSHIGGASAPRSGLLPLLAASQMRYASKHYPPAASALSRVGVALGAATHAVLSSGRPRRAGGPRAEPSGSPWWPGRGAPPRLPALS